MTREIFRVNVFIGRFHIGKMNEILPDEFSTEVFQKIPEWRTYIGSNTIVLLLLYFRKMNNRGFSKNFPLNQREY